MTPDASLQCPCPVCEGHRKVYRRMRRHAQRPARDIHELTQHANPDIADRICSLYALIDPRTEHVFYVGITSKPRGRACSHRTDPNSAAHHRIKEIHAAGQRCVMKIVAVYLDREQAADHERRLIALHPGLVNRLIAPGLFNGRQPRSEAAP